MLADDSADVTDARHWRTVYLVVLGAFALWIVLLAALPWLFS